MGFTSPAKQASHEIECAIECLERAAEILENEERPDRPLHERQARCLARILHQRTILADLAREVGASDRRPEEYNPWL
jgi:hypothetical protein